MIEVEYKWPCPPDNADVITGVTLNQEHVPNIGQHVSISVYVESGEHVEKYSKVEDVCWRITNDNQTAIVRLVR